MLSGTTDARLRLIISGAMGLLLTVAVVILWATGQNVPTELYGLVTAVWGFFTGHTYTNGTGAQPQPQVTETIVRQVLPASSAPQPIPSMPPMPDVTTVAPSVPPNTTSGSQ